MFPKSPHRPPASRRRKWWRGAIIILGFTLLLLAGSVIAYSLIISPPDGFFKGSAARKEGVYTVLLCGTDNNVQTDAIMVASLDTKAQKVTVLNIPRDTMVNVERTNKKINGAYGAGGIENLYNEISTVIGFKPDNYVIVNLKGLTSLIDTIGGVTFNVPIDMYYDDPEQNLSIHISGGLQPLNGNQATNVFRFRQNNDGTGYPRGDLQRIETQQALIKELAKKILRLENVGKAREFAAIFNKNVKSDLSFDKMLWYFNQLLLVGSDNINFFTLPCELGFYQELSYVYVNEEEALPIINMINPYLKDRTIDHLDIIKLGKK